MAKPQAGGKDLEASQSAKKNGAEPCEDAEKLPDQQPTAGSDLPKPRGSVVAANAPKPIDVITAAAAAATAKVRKMPKHRQFLDPKDSKGGFGEKVEHKNIFQSKWVPYETAEETVTLFVGKDQNEADSDEASLRWTHYQRSLGTISFETFESKVSSTSGIDSNEYAVALKCITGAKKLKKNFAKAKYFEPTAYKATHVFKTNALDDSKISATFFSMPFFSLLDNVGNTPARWNYRDEGDRKNDVHPVRSLLQFRHRFEIEKDRDSRQAIMQLGERPRNEHFIYVPELWAVVINMTTLITCSTLSLEQLLGSNIKLKEEYPGALVRITDLRGAPHEVPLRRCRTWVELLAAISKAEPATPRSEYEVVDLNLKPIKEDNWARLRDEIENRIEAIPFHVRLIKPAKESHLTLDFMRRKCGDHAAMTLALLVTMSKFNRATQSSSAKTAAEGKVDVPPSDASKIEAQNSTQSKHRPETQEAPPTGLSNVQITTLEESIIKLRLKRLSSQLMISAAKFRLLNPDIRLPDGRVQAEMGQKPESSAQKFLRRNGHKLVVGYDKYATGRLAGDANSVPTIFAMPGWSPIHNYPLANYVNPAIPGSGDLEKNITSPVSPLSTYRPSDVPPAPAIQLNTGDGAFFRSSSSPGNLINGAGEFYATTGAPQIPSYAGRFPYSAAAPVTYFRPTSLPPFSSNVPNAVNPLLPYGSLGAAGGPRYPISPTYNGTSYLSPESPVMVAPDPPRKWSLRQSFALEMPTLSPPRFHFRGKSGSQKPSLSQVGELGNEFKHMPSIAQRLETGRYEIPTKAVPFLEWRKAVPESGPSHRPSDPSTGIPTNILTSIDDTISSRDFVRRIQFPIDPAEYTKIEVKSKRDVITVLQNDQDGLYSPGQAFNQEGEWKDRKLKISAQETKIQLVLDTCGLVNCFVPPEAQETKLIGKIWGILHCICCLSANKVSFVLDKSLDPYKIHQEINDYKTFRIWRDRENPISYVSTKVKDFHEKCREILRIHSEANEGEEPAEHRLTQSFVDCFRDLVIFLLCAFLTADGLIDDDMPLRRAHEKVLKGFKDAENDLELIRIDAESELNQVGLEAVDLADTLFALVLENTLMVSKQSESVSDEAPIHPANVVSKGGSVPLFDIVDVYTQYTTLKYINARRAASVSIYEDLRLLREEIATILDVLNKQRIFIDTMSEQREPGSLRNLDKRINSRIVQHIKEMTGEFVQLSQFAEEAELWAKQSIDVRSEANNWAIYIFTAVTVIFLPLTFVTGLLSMNTSGLKDSTKRQWIYWAIAIPFTIMVIVIALFVGKFGFRDHWNRARPTLADSVEWFGKKFERITNSNAWWLLRYAGYLLSMPFRLRTWKTLLRRCLHPRRYYRYHY